MARSWSTERDRERRGRERERDKERRDRERQRETERDRDRQTETDWERFLDRKIYLELHCYWKFYIFIVYRFCIGLHLCYVCMVPSLLTKQRRGHSKKMLLGEWGEWGTKSEL